MLECDEHNNKTHDITKRMHISAVAHKARFEHEGRQRQLTGGGVDRTAEVEMDIRSVTEALAG